MIRITQKNAITIVNLDADGDSYGLKVEKDEDGDQCPSCPCPCVIEGFHFHGLWGKEYRLVAKMMDSGYFSKSWFGRILWHWRNR